MNVKNTELPQNVSDTLNKLVGTMNEQDRLRLATALMLSIPHTLMGPTVGAANNMIHADANMDRAHEVLRIFSHVERDVRLHVEALVKTGVELSTLTTVLTHVKVDAEPVEA